MQEKLIDYLDNEIVKKLIVRAMDECLTEVERIIINCKYGIEHCCFPMNEVAKEMGIKIHLYYAIVTQAENKLRDYFFCYSKSFILDHFFL